MPEEIKFQELLKENKYVERARGIQVILAAKTVTEKIKEERKKVKEKKKARGIRKVQKA
jgi:hypothetical protein